MFITIIMRALVFVFVPINNKKMAEHTAGVCFHE